MIKTREWMIDAEWWKKVGKKEKDKKNVMNDKREK